MAEIAPAERTVHVLLGCVVCTQPETYDQYEHACCELCGLAYFEDGSYYQERKEDCARSHCDGEMYYGW